MLTSIKQNILKPMYRRATEGLPLLGTPHDQAASVASTHMTPSTQADALIARYKAFSGATGFATGVPGFLALPITIPADLAGNALLQLHMAAAIAVLGGHDPSHDDTRARCIACLLSRTEKGEGGDEAEEAALRFGSKLVERSVRFMAEVALNRGTKLAVRRLPLLGGVLGGVNDYMTTDRIGMKAKETFLDLPRMVPEYVNGQ